VKNFAFIGQFAESTRDCIVTAKYSVRTGMEAVYQLLHIERGVPEVFGSIYDGIVGPLKLVDFSCDLTPNRRYDHIDGIEPPTAAFSRLASFQ
jgi:myosin-crossreactive antigen